MLTKISAYFDIPIFLSIIIYLFLQKMAVNSILLITLSVTMVALVSGASPPFVSTARILYLIYKYNDIRMPDTPFRHNKKKKTICQKKEKIFLTITTEESHLNFNCLGGD